MTTELNRFTRIKALLQDTKLIDSHTISSVVAECDAVIFAQRPAAQEGEVDIKSRVSELIAEHGTLRAAARSLNIDVGYLSRLEHGDKVHPSSETLAKIGLRDAGVKYQRLVFLPTQPAAQAGEVDDGDVTGQPGPLPETGWDEVPEDAFRKPSPTAGMNLGERIKHVGGRENAAGYIEFGSVAAVRALVRQYLRDLPAPQQATPTREAREAEQRERMQARLAARPTSGATADFDLPAPNDATQQATPEPGDDAQIRAIGEGLRSAHDHIEMHRLERSHCKDAERIREGLAAFSAYKKRGDFAATPEPVGDVWGWAIQDKHGTAQAIRPKRNEFFGCVQEAEPFSDEDIAKMDREWAGLVPHTLVTLYTRPAPGVPDGLPAVLTDWGFDVHDDEEGRTWLLIRNDQDDVARLSVPTFWPASGRQTIGAVVLHQFSAALTSALAAAQAKGGEQ